MSEMTAALIQINRSLASLEAKVNALHDDARDDADAAMKISDAASASRAKLYTSIEVVAERAGSLEGDVKRLSEDMVDVKIVTKQVIQWKHAGMGAIGAAGVIGSGISVGIAHYWGEITNAFFGR